MSAISERSPFKAGDRVRMHGYTGYPPGHRRDGFVGTVGDAIGGRYLRGRADDGREFCEPWAALVGEGEPAKGRRTLCCTCCPCSHHHPSFWGPGRPRPAGTVSRKPADEPAPASVDTRSAA